MSSALRAAGAGNRDSVNSRSSEGEEKVAPSWVSKLRRQRRDRARSASTNWRNAASTHSSAS